MRSDSKDAREAIKKFFKHGQFFVFEEQGVCPIISYSKLLFRDEQEIVVAPSPEHTLINEICENRMAYFLYGSAFGLRRAPDLSAAKSTSLIATELIMKQECLPENANPTHLIMVDFFVHFEKHIRSYSVGLYKIKMRNGSYCI